jgi:hypothetical protein
MAELLVRAKNDIRACARDHAGYVSANVLRNGCVNVIRDMKGSLHDRQETQVYFNGKKRVTAPSG